jgi:hypothetical protein
MKWTRRLALGLAALLTLTAIGVWELVTLPDAADRLAALPVSGLGFASRELPLTTAERDIYGRARGRQAAVPGRVVSGSPSWWWTDR